MTDQHAAGTVGARAPVGLSRTRPAHLTPAARASGRVSAWGIVALLIGAAGTTLSAHANADPDVYWHTVLGARWLTKQSLDATPDPIAFRGADDWVSGAWLVEIIYAVLENSFGLWGIYALRLALAAAFYAALWRYLGSRFTPARACLLFAGVGLPIALVLQDRPQTFSVVLLALLLPSVHRGLYEDVTPIWWRTAGLTWLWANLHGLWVLVPGLLAIQVVLRVSERRRTWRQPALLTVMSLAAAALTPAGPRLLSTAFRVSEASRGQLEEWAPTALVNPNGWGLAFCLVLLLVASLRGYRAPSREVLYTVIVVLFGLLAYRNAAFASLLLTPVLATALTASTSDRLDGVRLPRYVVALLSPVLALVAVSSYIMHADVDSRMPRDIAGTLAASTVPLRVVADYNVTGYLRYEAGDHVRLSIDGRADRWGGEEIREHAAMLDGRRGWREHLSSLDPDVVVVDRRSPVRQFLTAEGWRVVQLDKGFALLSRSPT